MKRYAILAGFCLAILCSGSALFAQQGGFTGPSAFTGGVQVGFSERQGFSGPLQTSTVAQVVQTFPDKARAILRGNIVAFLGDDRYVFRDASGETVVKIKADRWWGLSVGPGDLVELGGELKREKNGWVKYFDAKSVRRAI